MNDQVSLPKINLPLAWDRDRLVITEQWAIDKIRRKRLSASTAASIMDSPARFAIEKLLTEQEDPFAPAPLGTDAHAVLEDLMQLPAPERTIERADEILMARLVKRSNPDHRGWPGIPSARAAEWVAAVHENFEGLWAIEDPRDVSVYGTELRLDDVEIDGVPFIGFVDRTDNTVSSAKEPRLGIKDYKTGKPSRSFGGKPNHQHEQIRLYILAMAKHLDLPTAHLKGALYFTKKAFSRKEDVSAPTRRLDFTRRHFVEAWETHNKCTETGVFPCKPGPLCGWCPLVSVCPAAIKAGYVARIDTLPKAGQWNIPILTPIDAPMPVSVSGKGAAAAKVTAAELVAAARRTPPPRVVIDEDKPWVESGDSGELNPNSYAAGASFGLTALAVEISTMQGFVLNGMVVRSLATTLAAVVAVVQNELQKTPSLQAGLHTRLRSALRSVLRIDPFPLGEPEEVIADWVDRATKRVRTISSIAVDLWDTEEPEMPNFAALSNADKQQVTAG